MNEQAVEVIEERFERRSPGTLPAVQEDSPNAIIMAAIQKNYDPAFIEKMMDLAERNERNIARRSYVKAMADWRSNAPEIVKDKHVKFQTSKGTTEYKHASLGNVTKSISNSMGPFGLSPHWTTEQPDGKIKVTCIITHEGGHSESTSLTAGSDQTGNKNDIQAVGSTISYLERYTLLALTGLATEDMDDDGKGAGGVEDPITEDQAADIETMVTDLIAAKLIKDEVDFVSRLNRLFKKDKVDDLTGKQADTLIKKLSAIK